MRIFTQDMHDNCSTCNTTVTLPKPTVARRSVSQKWENRATLADCRPTLAPILADVLVGRRLFCRSTQVKSFVDRSADFQGFCHRWSVGRLSPDDRPTIGRLFEDFFITISAESRPIIGRQSADDRQTVGRWHYIKEPSADRRRISAVIRPMIIRLSADHKLWFVLYSLQCMYPYYLLNYIMHLLLLEFISFDVVYKLYLVFVLDFQLNSSYAVSK